MVENEAEGEAAEKGAGEVEDDDAARDAGQAPGQHEGQAERQLAHAEARAKAAEEKLAAREKELLDKLARLQADFDNYRRRAREDMAQATARGKTDFVKAILPVLDNLDRALAHTEDEGLRLLARQLQDALAAQGLLVLDPSGEAFDAKAHEAIASETREGAKSGTVLTVAEKGYALDGKLLRPARVVVAS